MALGASNYLSVAAPDAEFASAYMRLQQSCSSFEDRRTSYRPSRLTFGCDLTSSCAQSEEDALLTRQRSGALASTTNPDNGAEHELQTADTLAVSSSLVQVSLRGYVTGLRDPAATSHSMADSAAHAAVSSRSRAAP